MTWTSIIVQPFCFHGYLYHLATNPIFSSLNYTKLFLKKCQGLYNKGVSDHIWSSEVTTSSTLLKKEDEDEIEDYQPELKITNIEEGMQASSIMASVSHDTFKSMSHLEIVTITWKREKMQQAAVDYFFKYK